MPLLLTTELFAASDTPWTAIATIASALGVVGAMIWQGFRTRSQNKNETTDSATGQLTQIATLAISAQDKNYQRIVDDNTRLRNENEAWRVLHERDQNTNTVQAEQLRAALAELTQIKLNNYHKENRNG